MTELWNFAVVGPGGVGGLLGAVLARAGHAVQYVARPDTAAALNERGLSVHSAQFGDFHVPAPAVPRLAGPVDACLVAVKATQLDAALESLPAQAVGDGLVLPLLNGVDHMEVLRGRYPAGQVVAGAIRVESTRTAAGRIEHTSPFSWMELASHTAPPERVDALAARLRQAGFEVTVRDDETALLWDKLAFLAPLALLTTHAAGPVGEVREHRRDDLEAVIGEVTAVAGAAGAQVDPAKILDMFERVPAGMKSSMLRDAEAHRPTELDAIGGAVLRAADRYGVPAPVTARLVEDLRTRP
ncbi:ketopantoate reductase family protein [Phytohabitans rumicis]|uniref:2-dehydropantoate 2-reductase n=1 Tax=Phytohabitans rumicis TaxID=1076125 RepID=A0A6V8LH39_9ACTN|nr:ketopantoate reductase family protein [Phytohabitans rumicis]GFJ94181.1 2-dehydropantoate 2-reductase [Phytohabitans rumicis]